MEITLIHVIPLFPLGTFSVALQLYSACLPARGPRAKWPNTPISGAGGRAIKSRQMDEICRAH